MENFTEQEPRIPMTSCPNVTVCIVEVTIVIAVTFLVVVGNVGNLAILLSTPALRNGHGYLLISLSVADLITGLMASLAIYPSATLRSRSDSWPFGDTACLVAAYVNQVGIVNSAINLMFLSLERYVAIAHPLRYARTVTKKRILVCIALNWSTSAGGFSTIFIGFPEYAFFSYMYTCLPVLYSNPLFAWFLLVTIQIPALVIVVTSCIAGKNLHGESIGEVEAVAVSAAQSGTNIKVKTFRMVQVMTATFVLSYVPFTVVYILSLLFQVAIPQLVLFGSYWLLLANSFFNTVIYFTMNTAYRKRMGEMFDWAAATISRLGSRKGSEIQLSKVDSKGLRDSAQGSLSDVHVDCQDSVL